MRSLLLFVITISVLSAKGQSTASFTVDLSVSPTFEKVNLTITCRSDYPGKLKAWIIDQKQDTVKTIDLPDSFSTLGKSIAIEDLAMGKYSCIISQNNLQVYRGSFTKEIYNNINQD
jgi:hypothetical protein